MSLYQDTRALNWSASELARRFGVDPQTASAWINGRAPTPPGIAEYVTACRAAIEAIPKPAYTRGVGNRFGQAAGGTA